MSKTIRAEKANATREAILIAAERLFAEHCVTAVSNRQVSEAAGQGNNTAVGYHFGTKTDLVRAIVRKHAEPVEQTRVRMLAELHDSTDVRDVRDVRDWVACLVRPMTEHLDALGRSGVGPCGRSPRGPDKHSPTWFARFAAQVMTDPALREIMIDESLTSPTMQQIVDGLNRCLPDLPLEVHLERSDMARQLIVHMLAERERALAEGTPTPRSSWHDATTGLIDGIVGLWLAPVSGPSR